MVEVVGTFEWSHPEATDEDILGWIEFNTGHLLWPYLRSYVSMITGASGLPVLTLFSISVPSLTSGAKGEDDAELFELEPDVAPPELNQ